jgi:crossover junction endodeoxyribonuclease RuvC
VTSTRILGVDPGTRVAGWGIVESQDRELVAVAAGVIRAAEDLPIGERLLIVFEGIKAVLAEHACQLVAVEQAYFGKNARSAIRLGEGRAVAILAATLGDVPVVELAASLVKKAVCGHGGATKEQVRSTLEATLGARARECTAGLPMDATDALALAVAAHSRSRSPFAAASPRARAKKSRWSAADLARLGLEEKKHG